MNSSTTPGSSFDSFILSNLSNEKSNIEQFYESVLNAYKKGEIQLTEGDLSPISKKNSQPKWKRNLRNRLNGYWKPAGKVAHHDKGVYSFPVECRYPIDPEAFWNGIKSTSEKLLHSSLPVASHKGKQWFIDDVSGSVIFFRSVPEGAPDKKRDKFDKSRVLSMAVAMNAVDGRGTWRTLAGNRQWFSKAIVFLSPDLEFLDKGNLDVSVCGTVSEPTGPFEFDFKAATESYQKIKSKGAQIREGQPAFRKAILERCEGRCVITGTKLQQVLDAAHIIPYNGPGTNHVENGLMLRKDIHRLFDLGLIRIRGPKMEICLHKTIREHYSEECHPRLLLKPENKISLSALEHHWNFHNSVWVENMNIPNFYVALAHTDTIAYFADQAGDARRRISNTNLFPSFMKENLLFSMSFDSKIHYETMHSSLDPIADKSGLRPQSSPPKRVFADCGAFQYRDSNRPLLGDGKEMNHQVAWDYYFENHVQATHKWDEILLCAPDHIITPDMDDATAEGRFKFIKENAEPFLEHTRPHPNVHAVGVIHGRTVEERIQQYQMFSELGYTYVALGGMVPYSSKPLDAMGIIAGITDLESPKIASDSILARCRKDGIKLHVFGLNSPEWVRWWYRLQIDSFDGSKLSTEGAANGWYYVPNDGKTGRESVDTPTNVAELYQRIAVKKMGASEWTWNLESSIYRPDVPLTQKGIDTSCECPACTYLKSSRCTSERCWYHKANPDHWHSADPRMMGSTEHNMGRVAHNAFVFEWIIQKIETYVELSKTLEPGDQREWLKNWSIIEVEK